VGAVHDALDASSAQRLDELRERNDQRRRAGHVIEERQARARRDRFEHRPDDLFGTGKREWHARHDHPRAAARRHELEGLAAGAVGVIGRQDIVAGLQVPAAERRVDGVSRVRDEGEAVRRRPDECPERLPRFGEAPLQLAVEKVDRLPLDARTQIGLELEDRPRAGAEGAVIEVVDPGIERPDLRESAFPVGSSTREIDHGPPRIRKFKLRY